ncbi:MAG: sulfatase, partial [Myxococcota bacterium]
ATIARAGPAPPRRADNLLFLLIDTVRADRLGAAGYTRAGASLTPRMDRLAGSGSYFRRAWAQSSNTPRSVPSLLTGRYPSQLTFHQSFHNFPRLEDGELTLFEVLQAAGIHTVGYASHVYFARRRNVDQGFDRFDNGGARDLRASVDDIAAPRIVPKAVAKLAELAASGRRFAMFVHLFEPHFAYVAHPALFSYSGGSGVAQMIENYDYELAYVDRWVGTLLDALADSGLSDSTLVVLVSDHGEAFGAHRVAGKRVFFHGQTLHDEVLRVPLIAALPGAPAGAHDDPVMLIDIAPTVVEALGIARPVRFVGRSLVPRMLGQALPPRPVYAELVPSPSWDRLARMTVDAAGAYKLIHRVSDNYFELYHLLDDPTESKNLAQVRRDVRDRLQAALTRWVEVELPRPAAAPR